MVLGISKYDAEETASWLEENEWSFPILVDGQSVIEDYGLMNPDPPRPAMAGIPHPATIIIDKDGTIRFINVWVNYRERTPPATILKELKSYE